MKSNVVADCQNLMASSCDAEGAHTHATMNSSICSCLTDSRMLGQAHVIIQTEQLQPDAALHHNLHELANHGCYACMQYMPLPVDPMRSLTYCSQLCWQAIPVMRYCLGPPESIS